MEKTIFDCVKEGFEGFGTDLLMSVRESIASRGDQAAMDAAEYQWQLGVEKAVAAMLDLKVADEKIVAMLQKHWDFRLSEAERYLKEYRAWKDKHV